MDKTTKDVISMLNAGYAPSQIDSEMRLNPGTAKSIIRKVWKMSNYRKAAK